MDYRQHAATGQRWEAETHQGCNELVGLAVTSSVWINHQINWLDLSWPCEVPVGKAYSLTGGSNTQRPFSCIHSFVKCLHNWNPALIIPTQSLNALRPPPPPFNVTWSCMPFTHMQAHCLNNCLPSPTLIQYAAWKGLQSCLVHGLTTPPSGRDVIGRRETVGGCLWMKAFSFSAELSVTHRTFPLVSAWRKNKQLQFSFQLLWRVQALRIKYKYYAHTHTLKKIIKETIEEIEDDKLKPCFSSNMWRWCLIERDQ